MAYLTSEYQPIGSFGAQVRPFLRIALPVWRMPSTRRQLDEIQPSVTRDEIASIFGNDLIARRMSEMYLTSSERSQLKVSNKLRSALRAS